MGRSPKPKAANTLGYLLNVRLHYLPMESAAPAPQERSERFKELIARVIENSIKKAKVHGEDVLDDWKPISEAMDEFEKEHRVSNKL